MILEKIDDTRLLIALSDEDMKSMDLSFKKLNWTDDTSRKVIKKLLYRAKKETGFSTDDNKLMIEAIPQSNGCFVLVTLLAQKSHDNLPRKFYKIKRDFKPFIFSFKNSEHLLCAIERIYKLQDKFLKNKIIFFKDQYFLILYLRGFISSRISAILSEYSVLAGKDPVTAAKIDECGELIADDAINQIGKHLVS